MCVLRAKPGSEGGQAGRGFTLIELLVVIMILAIIVALVVSFGPRVFGEAGDQTTRARQEIIKNAIDAYYDSEQDYPEEEKSFGSAPPPFDDVDGEYARSRRLYEQLRGVEVSRKLIAKLPEDATENDVFLDGFGWVMDYRDDEALGGRPLIISAGFDNNFITVEDNIYSDGR